MAVPLNVSDEDSTFYNSQTGSLPEVLTAGGPDEGAASVDDAGDGLPVGLDDVVAAVDHALVPFLPSESLKFFFLRRRRCRKNKLGRSSMKRFYGLG